MESSACFMGTQRTLFCLTSFKFTRFSLSDRRYRYRLFSRKYTHFSLLQEKNVPLQQKKPALLSEGKSSGFYLYKVWYFSVLVQKNMEEKGAIKNQFPCVFCWNNSSIRCKFSICLSSLALYAASNSCRRLASFTTL